MGVVALRATEKDGENANGADALPEGFDAFWTLYPKKQAKFDARKAWNRIDPALHTDIIVAAARWRRVWVKRDEMQYVPLPASWLRGERWEDELPDDGQRPASSAHVPFAPSVPLPAKGEIPEGVRALLRKLTGRA